MRIFEIILLIVLTILPFIKRKIVMQVRSAYILLSLGALVLIHLLFEGYRWQMIPAYILLLAVSWRVYVVDVSVKAKLSFLRLLGFFLILVAAAFGWILPNVLPVFELPERNGPYTVGTEEIYVMTAMDEIITEDPNDRRELLYKTWYPSEADVQNSTPERYVDKVSRAGFAMKYGLKPSMLNYLDYVKTDVFPGIPVADGKFPVLIFSHGYGSKATGYYALLAELASQGYIVINMNHTYESLGMTTPDGEVRFFDYQFQQKISAGGMEVMYPLIDAFKNNVPYEERHPIVQKAVTKFYEAKSERRWAEDMIYTIDLLETWNREGELKGKLDLNRIGVFGHSNGGGAAGMVPLFDTRVKAAANLDGITWGHLIDTVYQIPFLYMSADWPADHEDINSHVYINKSTDYFYECKLLNSGHPNFMDIPFMIPVSAVAGTGAINPYEGMEIVNATVTTFFDKHLKALPDADLAEVGEQFGLLEMKIHAGDSIK